MSNRLTATLTILQRIAASNGFSVADTIVVAGKLAAQFAATNSQNNRGGLPQIPGGARLVLPTLFGRVDALNCDDAGEIPDLFTGWSGLFSSFNAKFGMTVQDVVAIMGAHTVSKRQRTVSNGAHI